MGDIVGSVLVCVRPGAAESMSAREGNKGGRVSSGEGGAGKTRRTDTT